MTDMNQYSLPRAARRNSAFTLVEIMVALAIMMLLLAIILVPVNMALNVFHIGKARNEVKAADQVVLNQLSAELRQAVYVFPNEKMPGITDKAPYRTTTPYSGYPYVKIDTADLSSDSGFTKGVCSLLTAPLSNKPANNVSRLDFIVPMTINGAVSNPLKPQLYIVTYYARRLDSTKPYDQYSNPVVLFRAQYKYRDANNSQFLISSPAASTPNADTTIGRFPTSCASAPKNNRASRWITQSMYDEPDLSQDSGGAASLPVDASDISSGSQTLITPRDMALVSPIVPNRTVTYADLTNMSTDADYPSATFQPNSSFTCDDSDGDGKIDRVTINLNMAKYDAIGAQNTSQQVRLSQTVDLPNVK